MVKYRRDVFDNERTIYFLKQMIGEISGTFKVAILNIEHDKGHFHMTKENQP